MLLFDSATKLTFGEAAVKELDFIC